ncbi:diguanylate cyclase domain-containing protein [Psychromonas aquimarina]|uniref:diguanylate cyclase domain-containing protein n=1 Tax=Psychromonas aquimarina TaxID=444919 RepID=UPI0003F4E55B|nr:diguanylate cyclase [Psychromonas aquimarina]
MLKLLSVLTLLLVCLSPVQAVLNESAKPQQINVYLDENLPFSGFNSQKKARGLLVDYWQEWSLQTGIAVNFIPYIKQDIYQLLSENKPAVYSGLRGEFKTLATLKKSALIGIDSQFYYFAPRAGEVKSSLINKNTPVVVGGLLAEAQQLPLFTKTPNIIYKEYLGLFEILLDIYNEEIDALVLFSANQSTPSLADQLLSVAFKKTLLNASSNELLVYTSFEQGTLLEWVQWGNQLDPMPEKVALAVKNVSRPLWGASIEMATNLLVIVCLLVLLFIFNRSKRRKDRQFKDILDSSPYPLAIFSLDGNAIFYLNDEVKSLFPFKNKKNKYLFVEAQNQLLLSRFINKVSHQSVIEETQIRLLVEDDYHDIEISAKRVHYQNHTVWLCYLKDVTALLRAERKLIEERELLRKVLDSIPEQIAFKSSKGTIIGCNKSWAKVNNTTVAHAPGQRVVDLMPVDVVKKQKQQEAAVWTGETFNTQEWVEQKNKQLSLVNITKVPLYDDKGRIFAILTIDSDITALHNLTKQLKDENLQRKETEKALLKQHVLLSSVFAVSVDPITLLDYQGRVIAANNAFAELMGSNSQDIAGQLYSELSASGRIDWIERQNYEVLESGEAVVFEELLFVGGAESCYEIHKAAFADDKSDTKGIVIMARDISAKKQIEEKLGQEPPEESAKKLQDQLTNIANRSAFDIEYSKLWQQAGAEQELLSVLMCDIDLFKPYNDNYGKEQGDQTLQKVAGALQKAAQENDSFVARYGGEEFAVLIKGGNATKALKVAESMRQSLEEANIEHGFSEVNKIVTMSMGLSSMFPSELNSMKMLMAEADNALYDAKMSGRDQISVH